ncbi:MAG TPA: cupin domain-containing protein [Actinomycetota bacterium]|jgi:ethanolamine utilization protein EutQ (cupin superfamily)
MGVTSKKVTGTDETTTFDHGRVEVVHVGDFTMRKNTFEPGWRWSEHVRPLAKTETCQVHHVGYLLSGRLGVRTTDGEEAEIGPGEAYEILPDHDGWVIGDEAVNSIEFSGS